MLCISTALVGCAPAFETHSASSVAADLNNGVACSDARSKIFDAYYQVYANSEGTVSGAKVEVPDGAAFKANLVDALKANGKFSKNSPVVNDRYEKALLTIHQLMTNEITHASGDIQRAKSAQAEFEREEDETLHLARLEMRSQLEPQYDSINKALDVALQEAALAAQSAGVSCGDPPALDPVLSPPNVTPDVEIPEASTPPARELGMSAHSPIFGALYTMATSYQSCDVLSLRPVTSSVESAQGVVKGAKVDSVGYGRVYTDVALLKRTHYYHRGQSYGPGCADQSKKPLVYDYGGRPSISTGAIDLFQNSGGGSALGIDCSAFISTAVAAAGNLYRTTTSNKPAYTRFVSRDFISPAKSGWSCYDSVETGRTKSIQSGDIGAVIGHVVMVDQVGEDPFGLAKVNSAAGCSSLSTRNFDFTVIQSSPEKGSLGINRYVAKDYLTSGGKMANLFLGYAKAACLARFDGKNRTPATAEFGLIRHKQTDACIAQKIQIANESCVQSCPALRAN